MAFAEEDEIDEDNDVDVEGEGEETQVVDDGVEEDDSGVGGAQDAETMILFTKPLASASVGNLGKRLEVFARLYYSCDRLLLIN
jgi:hypothetical protein